MKGWRYNPKEDLPPIVRACAAKVTFEAEWKAQCAAKKQKLSVYQCTYCRKWHLTKRPTPVR